MDPKTSKRFAKSFIIADLGVHNEVNNLLSSDALKVNMKLNTFQAQEILLRQQPQIWILICDVAVHYRRTTTRNLKPRIFF